MKLSSGRIRLSNNQIVQFVVIALLLAVIEIGILFSIFNYRINLQLADAKIQGESIVTIIQSEIGSGVKTTELLMDLYEAYGDNFLRDFYQICDVLCRDQLVIGSMYYAPGGVIRYSYPDIVDEATAGFDMLADPIQGPKAQYARDTKRITIAGPHNLIEGGEGIIIRNPHHDAKGEFDGFVVIVIDKQELFEAIVSGLSEENRQYDFAIWKSPDETAVTDEYGYIMSTTNKRINSDISIRFRTPNDAWYITLEPVDGWYGIKNMTVDIIIAIAVFIITIAVVYYFFREMAGRQMMRKAITDAIEIDELTGLYTKPAFIQHAREFIDKYSSENLDVMVVDFQNFKQINLAYGEEFGDRLLKAFADYVIKENSTGMWARYGGDQFVAVYRNLDEPKEKWLPGKIVGFEKSSGVSGIKLKCGIYENVEKTLSVVNMCDKALLALRSIKHTHEMSYAMYDSGISQIQLRNQLFETRFSDAIDNKEFVVWYQPKYNPYTCRIVGAEALVRWKTEDGFISPGEFLPVFERNGLIAKLDEYVFAEVCRQQRKWIKEFNSPVPVSINLSRNSMHQVEVASRYKTIAKENGVLPSLLPIEITESAAVASVEIKPLADSFSKAGFPIHMDDFGSGESAINGLNVLNFEVVKIDKSLVDQIGDPKGEIILEYTIGLVKALGFYIVAEGVETFEQLNVLKQYGCDSIQGYYFSRPLPADEFGKLVLNN